MQLDAERPVSVGAQCYDRRVATGDQMRPQTPPSAKFTYDDFLRFPNDGKRHEIIDGEHFVTPSPNTKHQSVSMNLSLAIGVYLKDRPIGCVFAAPFDVVFSNIDIVEPDLLYISRERLEILTSQHVRGAPDLVVEIVSPGTRRTDRQSKRELYERGGVQEYWLVDPDLDVVSVYRRRERELTQASELSRERGESLATPLLPDWSIPLAELFATPLGQP